MKQMYLFLLAMVLLLTACSKEKTNTYLQKEKLPSFDNVVLDQVFTPQDRLVQNEEEVQQTIQNYYQSNWEANNLWGSFLVAKGDRILYENYRGFAQDNEQQPITKETPLHVASISKTLTAMAVLKLIDSKKMNLDDSIQKFFPKLPYHNVTVKNLLNQRSGLPRYEYFVDHIQPQPKLLQKEFLTNKDILKLMIQYQPEAARKPDSGFMYANTNYAMLALIIEKVTNTSFPKAMKEMIFDPLQMKNTYIFEKKDLGTAARSFYNRGPKVHPYDQLDLIYGDKNVYTTPRDLLKFSTAMYADNFLSPELMSQVFTPYSNEHPGVKNYGLGFRLKIFNENTKLPYHTGWWHGTNSVFVHMLPSKVTIVSIGNKFSRVPYTAMSLSALFENMPFEVEKPASDTIKKPGNLQEVQSMTAESE